MKRVPGRKTAVSTENDSTYFCDPSGNRLELHRSDLRRRLAHIRKHPEGRARLFPGALGRSEGKKERA